MAPISPSNSSRYTRLRLIATSLKLARKFGGLTLIPLVIWFGQDHRKMIIDYEGEAKQLEVSERHVKFLDAELQQAQDHLRTCTTDKNTIEIKIHKLEEFYWIIKRSTVSEIIKLRFNLAIY